MRDRPESVMLFAAGFGTRMGDLTTNRPKPLLKVAGKPLLDHALGAVSEAGIPKTVVNTHYLAGQIETHLSDQPNILVSHETPAVLDTGGGLRQALTLLDAPECVFSMNTDSVWTGQNPFDQLAAAWDPERMDCLLLLIDPGSARGHVGAGDFVADPDGHLQRGPGSIFSGAQIIRTECLDGMPDGAFSLNLVWDRILASGRLFGVIHDGGWCDVGHPDGIRVAEQMLIEAKSE